MPIVEATLPLGAISEGYLQPTSTKISFDPLGLLAILHNPRAAASAARLYGQNNLGVFRWPHTMMVGGALPPFKLLVDHLSSKWSSIHPIIGMYKADVDQLPIRSDIAFSELPLPRSNLWLTDLLSFPPSEHPLNDILIIHIDSIYGTRRTKDPKFSTIQGTTPDPVVPHFQRLFLHLIGLTTTIILLAGLVFSILLGDMWSTVLFFAYFFHALASTAVSFVPMISVSDALGRRVREDATTRYAVHSRPTGGKVVFVGRQDELETWARTAWTFNSSLSRNFLHWAWMLTGSLAAAASVVCMVNMAGSLQLAYLGTLVISSFGELLVNRLVRDVQNVAIHYGESALVGGNEYWTQAIIRAALQTSEEFCLSGLPWCEFGLLPDIAIFRNLCDLLPGLRQSAQAAMTEAEIVARLSEGVPVEKAGLARRLASQIENVRNEKSAVNTTVPTKTG